MGYTIAQHVKSNAQIKKRSAIAIETLSKMKVVFANRNITVSTEGSTLIGFIFGELFSTNVSA